MIGIYGGTFDPVHFGHLRTAIEVQEIFALEQLRLLPCYQSPLKNGSQATAQQRMDMLRLAIENQPGLVCDSRELDRGGHSYMIDTLISLRNDPYLPGFKKLEGLNNDPLLLFMGNDAFAQLSSWHRWQQLFDYAHIVVMTRPQSEKQVLNDFFNQRLTEKVSELKAQPAGKLFFQNVTALDISSTNIRTLQAQQRSIRFLLPDNVIDYINQYQLYQTQH